MMTVIRIANGYRVYAKGASEIILARLVSFFYELCLIYINYK